jgi:hypothetical protein
MEKCLATSRKQADYKRGLEDAAKLNCVMCLSGLLPTFINGWWRHANRGIGEGRLCKSDVIRKFVHRRFYRRQDAL